MSEYQRLAVSNTPKGLFVTFNRPAQKNAIDSLLLQELARVLDEAERDPETHFLVLRGSGGFFCSGLDFEAFAEGLADKAPSGDTGQYMALLQRMAAVPVIIIAVIEGRTMAGGVGIAAACDLVFATPDSDFLLSEALWGLLPSCVTPFLIRRVGYQRAYRLTLTTTAVDGRRAFDWGLVDELDEQPERAVRRLIPRLARLDPRTVGDMKRFFGDMWLFDQQMAARAVGETERLLADPRIQGNIEGFVRHGKMPWQ